MLTATWTAALTGSPCSVMQLWVTSLPDCAGSQAAGDLVLSPVQQGLIQTQKTGMVTFTVADMVNAASGGDGGSFACGATGQEKTFAVCAGVDMSFTSFCMTGSTTRVQTAVNATPQTAATITYDTLPPGTPTITSDPAEGLDSSLGLSFMPGSPTATSDVFNFQTSTDDGGTWMTVKTGVSSTVGTTTIDGLTNNVVYQVRMFAVDAAGNQSPFSNVVDGMPVATSGFWGAYRSAGGGAQGCSAAPGAFGAGLGLLLALRWLRRRRA
jgi:hypothetical protein